MSKQNGPAGQCQNDPQLVMPLQQPPTLFNKLHSALKSLSSSPHSPSSGYVLQQTLLSRAALN